MPSVPELFDQALSLSGDQREAFLREACSGDDALLDELHALLAADSSADSTPAWNLSALANASKSNVATVDAAIGETVGAYHLVEVLGSGGMGKVYRAVRIDAE